MNLTKYVLARMLVDEDRQWGRKLTQARAINIIETLTDLIVQHFETGGDRVTLTGFGTFKFVTRGAFEGSDPRTGESIDIPARNTISFKPAAEVKRRINS